MALKNDVDICDETAAVELVNKPVMKSVRSEKR